MDSVKEIMASGMAPIVVGVVVAGIISYRCFPKLFRKEETWIDTDFPPDTVVLHHWPRSAYCPSLSPLVTKLETYFRVAKIPYVTVEHDYQHLKMGPKGKFPWITFNGQPLADSQFIIEFLNKKFGLDLDRGLTEEERGVSRALLKLTEDSLYWYVVLQRWVYKSNLNWFTDHDLPNFLVRMLTEVLLTEARGQGMGRHSEEEVYHIMEDDMTALSSVLEKLTNLADYCERVKDLIWPDWNEYTLKGARKAV